jgi:acid-sensing ion channel, other
MAKQLVEKFLLAAKALFTDYSKHSSVHGIKYIAEKDRSWFERIFWIAVFCVSLGISGKLIYVAWHTHPIIISFSGTHTPVWQVIVVLYESEQILIELVFPQIPFPSINICSTLLARKEKLNITDVWLRLQNGTSYYDLTEIE